MSLRNIPILSFVFRSLFSPPQRAPVFIARLHRPSSSPRRFSIGCFALFVPPALLSGAAAEEAGAGARVRVAFNKGAERYFMALDDGAAAAAQTPHLVLGRITAIEDDLAGPEGDERYGVPPFTAFHVVTLERM